jgi:phosphopantothenate---cysteine ligase (ATP)
LETDSDLLLPKSRQALERYGHQVVIGNDLHRRKFEVVFVSKKKSPSLSPGEKEIQQQPSANLSSESFVEYWLRIDIPDANPGVHVKEIEEDIVSELVTRHAEWIKNT